MPAYGLKMTKVKHAACIIGLLQSNLSEILRECEPASPDLYQGWQLALYFKKKSRENQAANIRFVTCQRKSES